MFCLLCKKHPSDLPQSRDVYGRHPAVRYRKQAIEEHSQSEQHAQAVKREMLQRASPFQQQLDEKKDDF